MSNTQPKGRRGRGRGLIVLGVVLLVLAALIYWTLSSTSAAVEDPSTDLGGITALITAVAGLVTAVTGLVLALKGKKAG